jgi:phosphoesterase RecJ-like protein
VKTEPRIPRRLVETLETASRVLVTTHRSPDGDAVGSSLALARALERRGKTATVWIPRGVPRPYRFLPGVPQVREGDDPGGSHDLTVVVDTSEPKLLEVPLPARRERGPLVVIDHHLTGGRWGDVVVCEHVAATGELVWELLQAMGVEVDAELATCIYVAVVTDTGMFRYDLTTSHTHLIAARCLDAGVRPSEVARYVYESYPASYLEVWAELLSTLEISLDGRFATLTVPPGLLEKHGASKDALEEVVAYPRGIEGVEVAALLRYKDDGRVRASLRSTGRVSAARLAAAFGGGGHFGAAGCNFEAGVDTARARELLEAEIERSL